MPKALTPPKTTTIQVLTKDRRWLELMFGKPTHEAFHRATELCPHPEGGRAYTTGEVATKDLAGTINLDRETLTVQGYYCAACQYFVFRRQRILVEAP